MSHIHPKGLNGKKWNVEIDTAIITESSHLASGDYTELVIDFWMAPASLEDLRNFVFDYDVVCHQIVTHKVFVLVTQGKSQTASIIELDIPTEKIKPLEIKMGQLDPAQEFPTTGITLVLLAAMKTTVLPTDRKGQSAERTIFYKKIIALSEADVESYFAAKQYQNAENPPVKFSSDREVIEYVANNKGAIGFVNAASVTEEVKSKVKVVCTMVE